MGLAIILRKNASRNHFRDIIIRAFQAGAGNNVLICSGFFQELYQTSTYRVSQEGNLAQVLASKNISVTTVGIHNSNWLPPYRNFRIALLSAGVSVTSFVTNNLHWHAKVLILKADADPVLGIVGSSNMTRNAFSCSLPFNYEADVFLWEETHRVIGPIMKDQLSKIEDPEEVIQAPYDPALNRGLTIPKRLILLEEEIFSTPYDTLQ